MNYSYYIKCPVCGYKIKMNKELAEHLKQTKQFISTYCVNCEDSFISPVRNLEKNTTRNSEW